MEGRIVDSTIVDIVAQIITPEVIVSIIEEAIIALAHLTHLIVAFLSNDFGATSHITNDISNIQSPSPYHGEDKMYINDGKGLSIDHVGFSTLHTPSFKSSCA